MPSATQKPGAFTAFVSGLQDAPATVRHAPCSGVRAILGISSPELVSRIIDFSEVWGRKAGDLIERLMAAGTWKQRFNLLDAVFVRALRPTAAPPRELSWAWDRLVQAHGCMPIRQLAHELGWSRRHFSERFRTELGVPPKTARVSFVLSVPAD